MAEQKISDKLDYISVPLYYSKDLIPWEEIIKDKFGPLFGYFVDFKEKGIDFVLKTLLIDTLFYIEYNGESLNNLYLIKESYIFYINQLKPENIEENKSEIDKYNNEIKQLEGNLDISIIKKYGILSGITLNVPYTKLTKDYAVIMGENTFIQSDLNSNYSKYWEDKQHHYLYKPDNYGAEKAQIVTVYIFSRVKGKILDITNSLSQITTNVSKTGGNFTLDYNLNYDLENSNYTFDNSMSSEDSQRVAFIQSLFRENDLVFIKFESLQVESNDNSKLVAGKIWDLIGLIDSTVISSDPKNISVQIIGRDLSKLIIEDQNIFIPYQFANSQKTTFGGASSKLFKRLFASGEYKLQFIYSMRSIEFTMAFIYNHLTNMEVLSSDGKKWLNREYGETLAKQLEIDKSSITVTKKNIEGIWGLIKLQVDEKVKHYRIADASISSPDGSIMNQFKKLAQEPFVELQFDTFGDSYQIIARRPPWDAESIAKSTMVIVYEGNAIKDTLSFDRDIYSIFQIDPQGALLGGNNSLPLSYIPMIVLDKYVEIWGNKFYKATTNYIDFNTYCRKTESNKRNPKEGFIDDLCWLIETMAYKPFTRVGTIVLKGDRRIKRGMWIYYQKTDEIFYVDAVQNSGNISNNQIERTTTIEVSRGMVRGFSPKRSNKYKRPTVGEDFARVEDIKDFKVSWESQIENSNLKVDQSKRSLASYFNLVDISFLKDSLKRNLIDIENAYTLKKFTSKVKNQNNNIESKSIVNEGIFEFFLQGKQFDYEFEKNNIKSDFTIKDEFVNGISYLK